MAEKSNLNTESVNNSLLRVECFWQQKIGNNPVEYEDAFSYKYIGDSELVVAISDGATESSFASIWAKILVHKFTKNPAFNLEDFQKNIAESSKFWNWYVKRRPLPWYAEEKLKQGAFATLLCVHFKVRSTSDSLGLNGGEKTGKWIAAAVGDSCLFQVRNNELINAIPFDNHENFSNSPFLVSSIFERNSFVWDKVRFYSGTMFQGDIFFLATDALSLWFLSEYKQGTQPWNVLLDIISGKPTDSGTYKSFNDWISDLILSRRMKNDDVTLSVVYFM